MRTNSIESWWRMVLLGSSTWGKASLPPSFIQTLLLATFRSYLNHSSLYVISSYPLTYDIQLVHCWALQVNETPNWPSNWTSMVRSSTPPSTIFERSHLLIHSLTLLFFCILLIVIIIIILLQGLHNVMEICRKYNIRCFAPSSIAAFGPTTPKDATPDLTIMRYISLSI